MGLTIAPLISDAAAAQFMGTKLNQPIPLAYGRHLVAGSPIFQTLDPATNNTTLFIALGIGEWDEVEVLWINGTDVTDTVDYHLHPGLDGETGTEVEAVGTIGKPAAAVGTFGTAANTAPGPSGSTYAWSNPNNAKVSDGFYATVTLPSPPGNTYSDYLELTNVTWDTPPPSGCIPTGIKVTLLRKRSGGTSAVYFTLQLLGVTGGSIKYDHYGVPVTASAAAKDFGSSADLWDAIGVDDTVLNDPAFGVRIYAVCTGTPGTGGVGEIDSVTLTAYYTVPPGGGDDPRRNQKICSFFPATSTGLTFSRTAYLSMVLAPDPGAPGPGFDVRGIFRTKKVRVFDVDGNETSYGFSQNPAWQILDVLLDYWIKPRALLDAALTDDEKAKIDFSAFVDAADYCDELITVNGVDVSRFESNVVFVNATNVADVLSTLFAQCRGYLLQEDGKFKLVVDKPRDSVFTFDSSNIIEGSLQINKKNTRGATNRFVMQSRNPESGGTDHTKDFAAWSKNMDDEAQQDFDGRVVAANYDFGAQTPERCERLTSYIKGRTLDLNRIPILAGALDSGALSPGDRVLGPADHEFGSTLDYTVEDVADNPDGTRTFDLQEYSESVYVDTADPQDDAEQTNIPGLDPAVGPAGSVIIADPGATHGVAWLTLHTLALAPSDAGDFSVAHSLGAIPKKIDAIRMTSGGAIWFQTPKADATNILLTASAGGVTGEVDVWL